MYLSLFGLAGRMIAKRYVPAELDTSGGGAYVDTTPVVAFTTRFDKASNKFFERELHAENRSHLYIPLAPGPLDPCHRFDQSAATISTRHTCNCRGFRRRRRFRD